MAHLDDAVIAEVYEGYDFSNLGRRPSETNGKSFDDAGEALFGRIRGVQKELESLSQETWVREFSATCAKNRTSLEAKWDTEWRELCDGKRLFREIQLFAQLKMPLLSFKKRIMERMRADRADTWRAVESHLKTLISVQ